MRHVRNTRTCAVQVVLTLVNAIAQIRSDSAIFGIGVVKVLVAHNHKIVSIVRGVVSAVVSRTSDGVGGYGSHGRSTR